VTKPKHLQKLYVNPHHLADFPVKHIPIALRSCTRFIPRRMPDCPERTRLNMLEQLYGDRALLKRYKIRWRGKLTRREKMLEYGRRQSADRRAYVLHYTRGRAEQLARLEASVRASQPIALVIALASRAYQAERKRLRRAVQRASAAHRKWRLYLHVIPILQLFSEK